jgi:hypothetical protein
MKYASTRSKCFMHKSSVTIASLPPLNATITSRTPSAFARSIISSGRWARGLFALGGFLAT